MAKHNQTNMISLNETFKVSSPYYIHRTLCSETLSLHRHDFYEIDIVLSGNPVSTVNGQEFNLSRGDVVLIAPSDYHSYTIEEGNPLKTYNIAFSMGLISPAVISLVPQNAKVLHLSEKNITCVSQICDFLCERYAQSDRDSGVIMKSSIEWLFTFLSEAAESGIQSSSDIAKFSEALSYINSNFQLESIDRDSVARIMHMSPTYFSKMFHKMVGTSFRDYLLNTRLNYAAGMLKMTDMTIDEIALSSGFNNESYFSKVFKKRFGVSPGKMRRPKK